MAICAAPGGQFCIDLHVHTSRYSPCAELLDAESIPGRMVSTGLHGVVITEHDTLWSRTDIDALNRGLNGRRIYRGIEISSEIGHVVVIGLESADGISPGMTAHAMGEKVLQNDAAAILVHPHLRYSNMSPAPETADLPDWITAVEVVSNTTRGVQSRKAVELARMRGWEMVAGSDAHAIDQLGAVCTAFPMLPDSEAELAMLIRSRSGVPMIAGKNKKGGSDGCFWTLD